MCLCVYLYNFALLKYVCIESSGFMYNFFKQFLTRWVWSEETCGLENNEDFKSKIMSVFCCDYEKFAAGICLRLTRDYGIRINSNEVHIIQKFVSKRANKKFTRRTFIFNLSSKKETKLLHNSSVFIIHRDWSLIIFIFTVLKKNHK